MSTIDPSKPEAFLGKMVNEMGAAAAGALVMLGDRLGIYRALARVGPTDAPGLAAATGLDERYLREWLSAQAASGYVSYDGGAEHFFLSPEQAAVFADPESPVALSGGFYGIASMYIDEWMIVEPFAGDTLAANLNPIGRMYYSFSTMICTPASKSQEVGLALGAQAGEKRLREAVTAGGFTRFRRASETPFNLILEARP
jgi:hypothetical protein